MAKIKSKPSKKVLKLLSSELNICFFVKANNA